MGRSSELPLFVPYAERKLARSLGAKWSRQHSRWVCTATRYRSAAFKRWRDPKTWQTIRVFPDLTPHGIADAKQNECSWDAERKEWCIYVTGVDTLTQWHTDRLVPPPEYVLRVSYEERERAKRHGARWNKTMKAWVLSTRAPLRGWAARRSVAAAAMSGGGAGEAQTAPVS